MRTLIINFKNHPEIIGENSLKLANAAERVAKETGIRIIVSPPTPLLAFIASRISVPTYSQGVVNANSGQSTAAVIPEAVIASGAKGTLINHSEARLEMETIPSLVARTRSVGLEVCLCVRTPDEARRFAPLQPNYIAVEPEELIGTGRSVSKVRPELISRTVDAARDAGFKHDILCGAGITNGDDVQSSIKLGASGILVSSSVVKAADPYARLLELANTMVG